MGRFIAFEGRDGAGKTSLVKATVELMNLIGKPSFGTREPGGDPVLGKMFRELLFTGKLVPEAELLVFLADRLQGLYTVVAPALVSHDYVFTDRYFFSTYGFQSKNMSMDELEPLVERFSSINQLTVIPDTVVHVEASFERTHQRKGSGTVEVNHFDLASIAEVGRREYVTAKMLKKYEQFNGIKVLHIRNESDGEKEFKEVVHSIVSNFEHMKLANYMTANGYKRAVDLPIHFPGGEA